jgi:hypothetical protein
VDHGVRDLDTGGKSVEDEASDFLFENLNEFAVGSEVVFVTEDGSGEIAGEGAGGAEVVFGLSAPDDEGVRAEDFVREIGLTDEFIEGGGEETGLCVKWFGAILFLTCGLRFDGGCLGGAGNGSAIVFARNSTGEKREWRGLLN